jgi:hypothetical protein
MGVRHDETPHKLSSATGFARLHPFLQEQYNPPIHHLRNLRHLWTFLIFQKTNLSAENADYAEKNTACLPIGQAGATGRTCSGHDARTEF